MEGLRRPARGRHVKKPGAPGATEMLYEFFVRCDDWLEIQRACPLRGRVLLDDQASC